MVPMVRVEVGDLSRFALEALLAMGATAEEADATAGALVYSELRFHPGQGQGVRRLVRYRERIARGEVAVGAPFEILKNSPALALVDAHNGMGSLVGLRAMRLPMGLMGGDPEKEERRDEGRPEEPAAGGFMMEDPASLRSLSLARDWLRRGVHLPGIWTEIVSVQGILSFRPWIPDIDARAALGIGVPVATRVTLC